MQNDKSKNIIVFPKIEKKKRQQCGYEQYKNIFKDNRQKLVEYEKYHIKWKNKNVSRIKND